MRYEIYNKNGEHVNTIEASAEFVEEYCTAGGYTYEEAPIPEPTPEPEPVPEQPDNLIRDEQGNGYEQIIIDGKITLRCVEFADGSCNY